MGKSGDFHKVPPRSASPSGKAAKRVLAAVIADRGQSESGDVWGGNKNETVWQLFCSAAFITNTAPCFPSPGASSLLVLKDWWKGEALVQPKLLFASPKLRLW